MNFLHIVVLIQNFHELQHLLSSLLLQRDRILRDEGDFGQDCVDFGIDQRLLHRFKIVRTSEHFITLLTDLHVFRPGDADAGIVVSGIAHDLEPVGRRHVAEAFGDRQVERDVAVERPLHGGQRLVTGALAPGALDDMLKQVSEYYDSEVEYEVLRDDIIRDVFKQVVPEKFLDDKTRFLVNPTVVDARTEVTTTLLSEEGFIVSFTDDAGEEAGDADDKTTPRAARDRRPPAARGRPWRP